MNIRYARRMEGLRASEIREILKLTSNPNVISFAGGLPAKELFPVREMLEVSRKVLEEEGCQVLQYSTTEGCPRLREAIAQRMNRQRGTRISADEILITSGSQQGLDLTGKILLDEGDVVLCESPTYLGAINAFMAYRPRFVEVPTDDDGMIISELENRIRRHDNIKLIYVIPDFQNPTGRTWSLERRRALMALATRHEIPIIEDCPYTDLRFEGDSIPSLKSMDTEGWVIYLGTFSKILCPGLRIGWLCAEPSIRQKYVLTKQGADLHTSTISQRQIATYLELFDIDANIRRIRDTYRQRRDTMIQALETHLPAGVRFTRPHGGLFLWVELPEFVNARDVLEECIRQEVAFVPGGSFFPNGGHENTLRLNYSAMPEARIEEGVRRLGRVLRTFIPNSCVEEDVCTVAKSDRS